MPAEHDRPAAEPERTTQTAGEASRATAGAAAGDAPPAQPPDATGVPDTPDAAAAGQPVPAPVPMRRTRRFPLFTRDTARPEGGGRAASGHAPAPARQWPVLAVLSTGAAGLLLTAFDLFRAGTLLVGLALFAGALLRWTLPSVGMLAVRSRFTDMVTYGVLGVVITLLAMMAQPHPWLEIPFLDDTLHYTIN